MAGRFSVEGRFSLTDRMSKQLAKITTRLDKMSDSARSASKALAKIDHGIGGIHHGIMTAAAGIAAGGAIAGVGLMHVVEAGAHFEQAITNVGAVMGKNRGQIADLEKEAMRLGVATQFSSTEVAEAMEQMARKGFDSGEILAGIPGVLNAIAASGEGMIEVSTVVGSTIRGFGLEAKQASHVADVLAYTAEKTGAHITDMGSALATAAPTAKALGVNLEDTAAAVGLMQKMGIDASTSGSAVSTMLAKISHPSKEAAQKMTAMGIKFKDAKGNMLSFRDVLGQFVKAGDKAGGNMDKMSFFAELVGLRGDKAALALSDMAKSGQFDELVKGLEKVDGYSEKVAKIRMDTTMGSWKLLTSTVEVLETRLFGLQSGPLRQVVDKTNAWVTANQGLIVQRVQDTIKDISDNLPLIRLGLKMVFEGVAIFYGFAAAVKVARAAVFAWQAAVFLATNAARLARTAVLGYQAAVAIASNPTRLLAIAGDLLSVSLGTVALRAGLAAAAVLAIYAAYSQLTKLLDETGGWGGILAGLNSMADGKGFAAGVDKHLNEQARARAAAAHGAPGVAAAGPGGAPTAYGPPPPPTAQATDQAQLEKLVNQQNELLQRMQEQQQPGAVPPPGGGQQPQVVGAPPGRVIETKETKVEKQEVEITIKDKTDSAEVTKPPRSGGGVKIRLRPSGAM